MNTSLSGYWQGKSMVSPEYPKRKKVKHLLSYIFSIFESVKKYITHKTNKTFNLFFFLIYLPYTLTTHYNDFSYIDQIQSYLYLAFLNQHLKIHVSHFFATMDVFLFV